MTEFVKKIFLFIRQNPRIIYSLVLVFFIPLAIYFNTYLTVSRYQENLNQILRSKAALAEDIAKFTVKGLVGDPARLNEMIATTLAVNREISSFEIYAPDEEKGSFKAIASSASDNLNREFSGFKDTLYLRTSWEQPDDYVNFISEDESGRHYNVVETVKDNEGKKVALVLLSLPMNEFDKMNNQARLLSYLFLFLTVCFVLLLMANNARLFGYALTLSKLKEIDQMKDTFISMASHELRAPLVSMKGNIEFFREEIEPHLNDDGRHYIKNIASSVERLEMLVGDILEVSRLEGNRIPIAAGVVEAAAVVEKSIEEIKPQAIQKGIVISYQPQKLPAVKTDPERAKQILINLLSNAVKYTLRGKVEVLTQILEQELLITVADTGVGISAADQAKLFQKFSRIYNDETREVSGTGLGLWISRELANKMGGDITVESIRGVGSHFTLHLPIAKK